MVDSKLIGISGKMGSGKDTVGKIIQDLTKIKNSSSESPTHQIKKFADKLKDIVCLLIGCTREQLEDREFKEKELGEEWWQYGLILENTRKPILYPSKKENIEKQLKVFDNAKMYIDKLTPRKLLQLLGTEAGRQILHPNIWINALFADYNPKFKGVEYDNLNKYYPNWIITDVRFPNEAQAIKDKSGILIRINRNNFFYDEDGKKCLLINNHLSETALDDYKDFDHIIENNGSIEDLITKITNIFQ